MLTQKRNTAYKVRIHDLISNDYLKEDGEWGSSYVLIQDKKITRVNLIATIISKYESEDKAHCFVVIDDFSSEIRVKTWREDTRLLNSLEVGGIINVIGRIRKYNDELYITPEIIKKIDNPNWELVRKLELFELYGKPKLLIKEVNERKEKIVEEQIEGFLESDRQKILTIIEKRDSELGVDYNTIKLESELGEEKIKNITHDLLREGEIYEVKSGRFRITR